MTVERAGKTKNKRGLRSWFLLCPRRHVLLLASFAVIGLFYAVRSSSAAANAVMNGFSRPWHRIAGRLVDWLPFSAAELLYTAIGVAAVAIIVRCIAGVIRDPGKMRRIYCAAISLACMGLSVFGLYCILWSTGYYADSFSDRSGLKAEPVTAQELEKVTAWFVEQVNANALMVERDAQGIFAEEQDSMFENARTLYRGITEAFPILEGPELKPKKMVYSKLMSVMNFTGFFFPITGEANLNTDSPACLLPATLAHEIAHQRGVAAEDEANFAAVAACMASEDPVFRYSGALLAYIHLGNALYDADYEAWERLYYEICPEARADLNANNAYWDQYETKVSQATEAVYTGYLQSNDQELGMKSYGACVDLLVAWYGPRLEAMGE